MPRYKLRTLLILLAILPPLLWFGGTCVVRIEGVSQNPYEAPRTPHKPRPRFSLTAIVVVTALVVLALFIAVGVVCTLAMRTVPAQP